jgi:hypothetical protein
VATAEQLAAQLRAGVRANADEAYKTGRLDFARQLLRHLYWQVDRLSSAVLAEAFGVKVPHLAPLAGHWPSGVHCRYCSTDILATSRSARTLLADPDRDAEAGAWRSYQAAERFQWRYCDACFHRMRPASPDSDPVRAGVIRS